MRMDKLKLLFEVGDLTTAEIVAAPPRARPCSAMALPVPAA
jgi:hypothetical protein